MWQGRHNALQPYPPIVQCIHQAKFDFQIPSGILVCPQRTMGDKDSLKCVAHLCPGGGGVLDQILDGDVPSRFQKHTRSLYQFFENVYPTLYKFFKNIYPTLYQFSEKAYPTLYQLRKLKKSIPFLIPNS